MNIENHEIRVNGLAVQIVRKDIKNLHLGVDPPNGRVRVAAPLAVNNGAIRLAVIGKIGWIKRRKASFISQARQSKREMVSGESHYYLGRRFRLRVILSVGPALIALKNQATLEMRIRPDADARIRLDVLNQWYRERLRELVPPLLMKWEKILGVNASNWGIKRMKTKWGSCNPDAKRIWINLELAKKPVHCLEYIIAHELTHLTEKNHNDHFIALMDRHLPKWRLLRQELNSAPLSHEMWGY